MLARDGARRQSIVRNLARQWINAWLQVPIRRAEVAYTTDSQCCRLLPLMPMSYVMRNLRYARCPCHIIVIWQGRICRGQELGEVLEIPWLERKETGVHGRHRYTRSRNCKVPATLTADIALLRFRCVCAEEVACLATLASRPGLRTLARFVKY